MDTLPAITACILAALHSRDVSSHFHDHCNLSVWPAAMAQDQLSWLFLMESKISSHWLALQANSLHSASQWAAGLVMVLLMITHSQWTHHNSILHTKDAHRLWAQDACTLQEAIDQQFQTGLEGLYPQDYHLIE